MRQGMTAGHVAVSRSIAIITYKVQRDSEVCSHAKSYTQTRSHPCALRRSHDDDFFFSGTLS